jgi:hypothetical protein
MNGNEYLNPVIVPKLKMPRNMSSPIAAVAKADKDLDTGAESGLS